MDWNSDGELDVVSGDREGYFNVFIRQGGELTGYYQYKLMDSTVLKVDANSHPAVIDWNGDGKKDLILGSQTGYIYFYPNQTSDTWPMFQDYSYLEVRGSPINRYRVNPYIFDLDRDTIYDLICGADDGYILFYKNVGTNATPVFLFPETLRATDETPIQPSPTSYGSRCAFGYWNSDTLPDFLLSGYDGTVDLYLGTSLVGTEEPLSTLEVSCRLSVTPIPGRPPVRIQFSPVLPQEVQLIITDVSGRKVRTVILSPCQSEFVWNGITDQGTKANSGVYFCGIKRPLNRSEKNGGGNSPVWTTRIVLEK
ncbi:MAG: FG-GAP-like repeat-containing protein [candidate division WOR-3 bacterium]